MAKKSDSVVRSWTCPKCAKSFMAREYILFFRDSATLSANRKITEMKIKHKKQCPGKPSSGCFISSACVQEIGSDDNCYELQTLRRYRDDYLLASENGKALVQKYYAIAPKLVEQIANHPNHINEWNEIYTNLVKKSVSLIDNGEFEDAKQWYEEYVNTLLMRYAHDDLRGC